jgi:hypothetical protein
MNDEIDELLIDWYDYEAEYTPKLGHERASVMCRDYRSRWQDSDDLADRAQANARKLVCEAVGMCVQKLDLQYRVAIQTVMRNWRGGAKVFNSIRLDDEPEVVYERAKKLLAPMMYDRDLIERVPSC